MTNVAVLGLGVEGKDIVNYLTTKGIKPHVFDEKPLSELDLAGIDRAKIELTAGPNAFRQLKNHKFDAIYRSPGVYRYLPVLKAAEKAGAILSSATQAFFDNCLAQIIGVTGTKGKGTTSTLIHEILQAAGKKVYLAGNIGQPMLALLPKLKKGDFVVLELSSFQLIDLTRSPHIAVVLNITTDHMDWHATQKEYVDAKKQIVAFQRASDFAVINADYKTPLSFAKLGKAKKYFVSSRKSVSGSFSSKGKLYLNIDSLTEIGETKNLLLRGQHNWENITAAICASSLAGVSVSAIRMAVFSFKGLEHRLELVGELKGRTFYNDSFATGPQPTLAAVNAFTEPVTLILGGFDKKLEYEDMVKTLSGKVAGLVLIGDLADRFEKQFVSNGFKGRLVNLGKAGMSRIVKTAIGLTMPGGVVLLSPAAASFDMFADYKERGNRFKNEVNKFKK